MTPTILSKLPKVGTSIFTEMSVLAQQQQAINLGQGFPDFDMSSKLTSLVNEAMQQGHNQYAHTNGLLALRESLAEKINIDRALLSRIETGKKELNADRLPLLAKALYLDINELRGVSHKLGKITT